jgi:hypothetical protein
MSNSELPTTLPTVHERLADELKLARGFDIPPARPLIDSLRADIKHIVARSREAARIERGAALPIDGVQFFGSGRGNDPQAVPAEEPEPEVA